MINEPQMLSLATAVARLAEGDGGAPVAQTAMPALAPAATDAIALTTAFGLGAATTSLADAAQTLSAAMPPSGQLAAGGSAALQTVLAGVLRDLAAQPGGTPYANPAVARGLATLVAAVAGNAAMPPSAMASLAGTVAVLRAAVGAPAGASAGAFSSQLRDVLASDPVVLAPALAAIATSEQTLVPSIVVPPYDLSQRSFAGPQRAQPGTLEIPPADDALVAGIPERDPSGRRYSSSARRRLAELGTDPRHGFAPEAEVALAAEERYGVSFARAFGSQDDFVDESGRTWNVFAPRSLAGAATTLTSLAAKAGVLVSAIAVSSAERGGLFAEITRLAAGASHPIVVLDGPGEQAWPTSS